MMKKRSRFPLVLILTGICLCGLIANGIRPGIAAYAEEAVQDADETVQDAAADAEEALQEMGTVEWDSLACTGSMELVAANQFSVDYYEGGYKRIHVETDQEFLLVPKGMPVPEGLEDGVVVLQQPLDQIYLVATAAMDYFVQLGSIDHISLSSQKESGWYLAEAKEAVASGQMLYAGKYSAPDYELILATGCDLAIENTMIYHTSEVLEQLERLGIPALIERSSYETNPLGRMEWLKLYAALVDQEDTAEAYYSGILEELQTVMDQEPTGKTVAFFSINANGAVNVRKSGDYIAKSIDLAGGQYVSFDESEEENALSTMNIQMETFYADARDADILIYNSTIEGELQTIDQLLAKSALLADFKAVQEGNVWCIEKNFYQESLELGDMILDINQILTNEDVEEESLHFLHRLK